MGINDSPTERDGGPDARRRVGGLWGRSGECEALDELVAAVRAGQSRALVVLGETGVGKTALLDYAAAQARDCRVVRAAGVQSEMELAFAGLQQLCAPMLERLPSLPAPQREALGTAFGLAGGEAPDRFLVGLAALGLLADAAAERPLVCLVDDVHWLDRASVQALAFLGRRLLAESVGLVLSARSCKDADLDGLPELRVEGLRSGDARALLSSVVRGPLDERVRDRIIAETRGNPLAILELPRELSPAEIAGGFGLPEAAPLAGRIEASYQRRLARLPAQSTQLLLVAAADPVGEPVLMWRAAQLLGIGAAAAVPVVAEGLAEFGTRVRFRHPLVRSAVYTAAPLRERQQAHAALAEATDPQVDPDRRAWHRAQAAPGPDEEVAAELERSAGRAQSRGGLAAAAAFLERAAALTMDPARRAERALAAAQVKNAAGAPEAAASVLATAEAGPLDRLQRARADLIRAQIAYASNRGRDAPPLLLAAARALEPLDVRLARDTYLDALAAATFAGRLSSGVGSLEVAEAARAAPPALEPPRAADLLLNGQALLITSGYAAAAPTIKAALRAFRGDAVSVEEELRWQWFACRMAMELWDDDGWWVLAARAVKLTRDAGALTVLPIALNLCAGVHVITGDLAKAEALIEESREVSEATRVPDIPYGRTFVAAWRGREDVVADLIETGMRGAIARGEGRALGANEHALAVLNNGLGRYEAAFDASQRVTRHNEMGLRTWTLPELVEAAVRTGELSAARAAYGSLRERARASGTDWGLGIEARSAALLSDGADAESRYREAIERLGRSRASTDLARVRLLYGEWLRRERRRTDAREQLRAAHDQFAAMGAEAFARRAARELQATGETARKRRADTRDDLTAQEAQIARMARDGLSNPEIGARLFISPRTVEYHLRKVFGKLGISSRNQLGRALGEEDETGVASLS